MESVKSFLFELDLLRVPDQALVRVLARARVTVLAKKTARALQSPQALASTAASVSIRE